jgi:hypothetical protein
MSGLSDAAALVTTATVVVVAAASYVQFILKRSVLPSAQFDVHFVPYVRGAVFLVGEIEMVFKNVGSTMLIVTGVRSRIRYRLSGDGDVPLVGDPAEPGFYNKVPTSGSAGIAISTSSSLPASSSSGASNTSITSPSSVPSSDPRETANAVHPGWLELVRERTFIQPGVTQDYRKPIVLPTATQLVHIWGAFDYQINTGRATRFLIKWLAAPPGNLDWRDGVENHTARRTFLIPTELPARSYGHADTKP